MIRPAICFLFSEAKGEYGRIFYYFLTSGLDIGNFW